MNLFTKRFLSVTVALFLVFSLFSFSLSAETPQTLKVTVRADKTEVKPGDIVTYTVSIGSVQSLMAIRIQMSIPDGLTYVNKSGKVLGGVMDALGATSCSFTSSTLCFLSDADPEDGYSSSSSLDLFSIQCSVDSDANGDITMGIKNDTEGNNYTKNGIACNVQYSVSQSKITVKQQSQQVEISASVSGDTEIKLGETAKLTCSASVSDGSSLSYQWYSSKNGKTDDGSPISGETDSKLSVKPTSVGTVYYFCRVSTENASLDSDVWTVKVAEKEPDPPAPSGIPVAEISADSHDVEQNKELKIECSASVDDGSKLSYVWYKTSTGKTGDGKPIDGATGTIYSVKESEPGEYYYFCCVSTDKGNKKNSNVWKVVVSKIDVAETIEIVTSKLDGGKVGESYKDYIRYKGTDAKLYFKDNANPIPGLSLSTAGTLKGTPTEAGKYKFTVVAKLNGEIKDEKTYTLVISEKINEPEKQPEPEISFEQINIDSGIVNREYYYKFDTGDYSYVIFTDVNKVGEFDKTGLILADDGTLIGTPAEIGQFVFYVHANDGESDKYYEVSFTVEEQPDITDEPTEPDDPGEEDDPDEPTQPDDPAEPQEPDDPAEPQEPDEPVQPGEQSETNTLREFFINNRSMIGWVLAGILSIVVLVLAIALAKKSNYD